METMFCFKIEHIYIYSKYTHT